MSASLRLDRLLGRRVLAANNHPIGRIEEFRVDRQGRDWMITSYVIGVAGLWERLGLGARLLFGRAIRRGYVARWDQIDLSHPDTPRLRCSVDALEPLQDAARTRRQ